MMEQMEQTEQMAQQVRKALKELLVQMAQTVQMVQSALPVHKAQLELTEQMEFFLMDLTQEIFLIGQDQAGL
jgi:hypothetical protein